MEWGGGGPRRVSDFTWQNSTQHSYRMPLISSWKRRFPLARKPASLSFLSAGMNWATMEQASSKQWTRALLGFQSLNWAWWLRRGSVSRRHSWL